MEQRNPAPLATRPSSQASLLPFFLSPSQSFSGLAARRRLAL
jgi:hypothetical protein